MSDPLAGVRERAFQAGYRMLGSRSDADDVAQETLLRVQAALDAGELRSPEAYATTVATRIAIDHLRSARVRRESYRGPWLPEPIIEAGVEDHAEIADSVSYALMVVLERLAPVERAAFLLREVFGFDYGEIASTLERSEPATRQLVHRARKRLAADRPKLQVDPVRHRQLLDRFLAAATSGDVDGLQALLADDVRLVSDGGAEVKAARHPILGRDRVSRFLLYLLPRLSRRLQVEAVSINGGPGFVLTYPRGVYLAGTIEVDGERISAIHWVLNREKLPTSAGNEPEALGEGSVAGIVSYVPAMAISPDTKDWTWVVEQPCPECGFDPASVQPEEVGTQVRDQAAQWLEVLARPADEVRHRPDDETWSALEYACHVRDVYALYDHRLELMVTQDDPTYENWDQDVTAVEERYGEQDPAVVGSALAAAAAGLADRFDALAPGDWARTGNRSDGARFTVDSFARYLLHDPFHHLWDVRAG